jgi:hypothetical protein
LFTKYETGEQPDQLLRSGTFRMINCTIDFNGHDREGVRIVTLGYLTGTKVSIEINGLTGINAPVDKLNNLLYLRNESTTGFESVILKNISSNIFGIKFNKINAKDLIASNWFIKNAYNYGLHSDQDIESGHIYIHTDGRYRYQNILTPGARLGGIFIIGTGLNNNETLVISECEAFDVASASSGSTATNVGFRISDVESVLAKNNLGRLRTNDIGYHVFSFNRIRILSEYNNEALQAKGRDFYSPAMDVGSDVHIHYNEQSTEAELQTLYVDEPPQEGLYHLGSHIINRRASAGEPAGWVVTASGAASNKSWVSGLNVLKDDWIKLSSGKVIRIITDAASAGTVEPSPSAVGETGTTSGIEWVCESLTSCETVVSGQTAHRLSSGAPTVTPNFIGEEILDANNKEWYKAIGSTAADWRNLVRQAFYRQTSNPSTVTPQFVGEEILNTSNNDWYKAIGSTSSDWTNINRQTSYRQESNITTLTPRFLGEEVLETTNDDWYKAIGTDLGDWKKLT